jgi:hypothetical protein
MTLTAEMILKEVEKYVNEDVTLVDAIVHYSELHNIEIELIGEIIRRSVVLKSKVREHAENLNLMVEKTAKLPV